MIVSEAVSLIAYLNRAGLVGAVEGGGAVWADALEDIAFPDAQHAARELVRTRTSDQRWVVPGDIRAAVKRHRATAAIEAADPDAVPDADPADVRAYIAAIRAGRYVSTAGQAPHPERVQALISQAASTTRIPRKA